MIMNDHDHDIIKIFLHINCHYVGKLTVRPDLNWRTPAEQLSSCVFSDFRLVIKFLRSVPSAGDLSGARCTPLNSTKPFINHPFLINWLPTVSWTGRFEPTLNFPNRLSSKIFVDLCKEWCDGLFNQLFLTVVTVWKTKNQDVFTMVFLYHNFSDSFLQYHYMISYFSHQLWWLNFSQYLQSPWSVHSSNQWAYFVSDYGFLWQNKFLTYLFHLWPLFCQNTWQSDSKIPGL